MNNTNIDVFAQGTKINVVSKNTTEIHFDGQESFSVNVDSKKQEASIHVDNDSTSKVSIYDRTVFGNGEGVSIGDAETLSGYYHHQFAKKAEWETITGRWNFNNRLGILTDTPLANLHNKGTTILEGNTSFFGDLTSKTFASGITGYGLRYQQNTGTLELDNIIVRKLMQVTEFQVQKIRAVNGSLWVSDTGEIIDVVPYPSYWRCYVDGNVLNNFEDDDIVRCQVYPVGGGTGRYYIGKVVSYGQDYFDVSKTLLEGNTEPQKGDKLVRQGNESKPNRQGVLYLTASDSGAPYMDVLYGVTGASIENKTAVRVGRLDGLQWGIEPLSGMGFYGENVFLTGVIKHKDGNWSLNADGSGMLASGGISWDANGVLTIGGYAKSGELSVLNDNLSFFMLETGTDLNGLRNQIDGKIEYWYTPNDPSTHAEHTEAWNGGLNRASDIWYNTSKKETKRWNGLSWDLIEDNKAISAGILADKKRTVFTGEPYAPYKVGDLWLTSLLEGEGDIKKCVISLETGTYNPAHWKLASKYTGDEEAKKKSTIYRDPNTPPQETWDNPSDHIGDTWFTYHDFEGDIGIEIQPYYWDGTNWILDVVKIDGGRINAGSITANKIVVDNLFAQKIYSSGATIGGVDIAPQVIVDNGINGLRLGNVIDFNPEEGKSGIMFGMQNGLYKTFIGNHTENILFDGTKLYISGFPLIGTGEVVGVGDLMQYFEIINKGQANQYLRAKIPLASQGEITAFAAGSYVPPSLFDSIPIASRDSKGIIQVGAGLTITNGILSANVQSGGVSTWGELSGKPSWLNHSTLALFEAGHRHDWGNIDNKPSTFTPSAHTHTIANITSLQSVLDGKAASVHTHTIANVTGLQSALDGKSSTSHTHNYLPASGTAVDSSKLGGFNAGDYTRRNVAETITGAWTFASKLAVSTGVLTDQMTLGSNENTSLNILNATGQFGLIFGTAGSGNSWIQGARVDGDPSIYNICLQPNGGNVGIGYTGNETLTDALTMRGSVRVSERFKLSDKWSIGIDGNDLFFYNASGNKRAKIDQSGNLVMAGEVTAFGLI